MLQYMEDWAFKKIIEINIHAFFIFHFSKENHFFTSTIYIDEARSLHKDYSKLSTMGGQ
jgi:hypothetical protein